MKIFRLLVVTFWAVALPGLSQERTFPPASQAEANAGIVHDKFIAPDTLLSWGSFPTRRVTNTFISSYVTNTSQWLVSGAGDANANGVYTYNPLTGIYTNGDGFTSYTLQSNNFNFVNITAKTAWSITNSAGPSVLYRFAGFTVANIGTTILPPLWPCSPQTSGGLPLNPSQGGTVVSGTAPAPTIYTTIVTNWQTNVYTFLESAVPISQTNRSYLVVDPSGSDVAGYPYGGNYATISGAINACVSNFSSAPLTIIINPGVNTNTPAASYAHHFAGDGLEVISYPIPGQTFSGFGDNVSIYETAYNTNVGGVFTEPYILVTNNVTFQNCRLPRLQFGEHTETYSFTNLNVIDCTVQDVSHTTDFHGPCYNFYARDSKFITQGDMFSDIRTATFINCLMYADLLTTTNTPNVNNGLECVAGIYSNQVQVVLGGKMFCYNGTNGIGTGNLPNGSAWLYTNACVKVEHTNSVLSLHDPWLFHGNTNGVADYGVWIYPGLVDSYFNGSWHDVLMIFTNISGSIYTIPVKRMDMTATNGVIFTNAVFNYSR